MVTQLPSTGKPGCDTSDLFMIHGMYRKVYGDAPATVRGVAPGNTAQRDAVALHVDDISKSLHAHHHGEDIFLWDQLSERAPACAAHVDQMREQHAQVALLLDRLDELVLVWREDDSAAKRDAVAETLDEIRDTLFAHLGQEEKEIEPVAAVTMTQDEWDQMGVHGRASVAKNRQLASLGYILSSMSPEEGEAWMKANLPAPIRLLWRVVGKRNFAAQTAAMRGV